MKHWWKVLGIVPIIGGIYYACNTPETKKDPSLEETVEDKRDSSLKENQRASKKRQKETPKHHPQEEARTDIHWYQKQKKKELPQNAHPQRPTPVMPKYALPEDDTPEEYPSYYIPPEERKSNSVGELMMSFDEAIKARDYKIAETYIEDILNFIRPPDEEWRKAWYQKFMCTILADYDQYLSSIIENCKGQDAYSVLSKVIWMKSFLNQYQNTYPNTIGNYCFSKGEETKIIDPDDLAIKGKLALDSVINCADKEHHE